MISCDFAPNEQWDDAWLSLKLLFQPWRWKKGKEVEEAKPKLLQQFEILNLKFKITFFYSGRSALFFLLQSLDLPKGAEVIVQGFTCEAVILPILANNLKPVYADIESSTFSINPIDLESKINTNTKAIILQHTYGITPMHREKIRSISKKNGLVLIEDIAHGAQISNLKSQISNSIFLMSFGRSKALSSVFGGAILTNDKTIARNLEEASLNLAYPTHWDILRLLLYKPLAMIIKSTYDWGLGKILHEMLNYLRLLTPEITEKEKTGKYDHSFEKAYPNALAILLLHQLNKLEEMKNRRKEIHELYQRRISNSKLKILNSSIIRLPLLIENRDYVVRTLAQKNIFLGLWYNQVVGPKGFPLERGEYRKGSCPTAERICQSIINLPTNITAQEAEKILKILNDVK